MQGRLNKSKTFKCPNCNRIKRTRTIRQLYCSIKCAVEFRRKIYKKNKRRGKCYVCPVKNNLHEHHILSRLEGCKDTVLLCQKHHVLIHKFIYMLSNINYRIVKIRKIKKEEKQ